MPFVFLSHPILQMSNSLAVMRLLQNLQRGGPGIIPLAAGGGGRDDRRDDYREEDRRLSHKSRERSPPRRESRKEAPRKERRKKRAPSPSSSESESPSESESASSSSGYSSYESVEEIKKKIKAKPCPHVSPAGLGDKKTKKEAIKYLKEKECPRVDEFKKTAVPSPASAPAAAPAPVALLTSAPPADGPTMNVVETSKRGPGRPKKEPVPKKRAPSAYNLAFAKHRKSGKTFAEATALAKADNDKMKAEKTKSSD